MPKVGKEIFVSEVSVRGSWKLSDKCWNKADDEIGRSIRHSFLFFSLSELTDVTSDEVHTEVLYGQMNHR